jgi:hypothetical protein
MAAARKGLLSWEMVKIARMACKPGSVPGPYSPMDDHSSANRVATAVKLPTRASGLKRPCGGFLADQPAMRPLFGIAPGGACLTVPVARPVVGSYSTVSPLPRRAGQSLLCGAFPGVAPAGRYPAPCLHGARTFLGMSPPRGHPAIRATGGISANADRINPSLLPHLLAGRQTCR